LGAIAFMTTLRSISYFNLIAIADNRVSGSWGQ